MSEFLTQTALAQRLVQKTGIGLETARKFSSLFFLIVKKGLKDADKFSVYNFGTFKKTWIEEAFGLNPSNGQRITIPAHWRIKFVPCPAVARRINRPFAHLKPKIINEKITEDGLYAKASRIAMESSLEKKGPGLLAVADKIRHECPTEVFEPPVEDEFFKSPVANNDAKKARKAESSEIGQESAQEIVSVQEEGPKFSQEVSEISKEDVAEGKYEEKSLSDEIDDCDENDGCDEEISGKKKCFRMFAIFAGVALLFALLVSLIVKNCSGKLKNKREKSASASEAGSRETADALKKNNQDVSQKIPAEKNESSNDEIDAESLFEAYTVPTGLSYHKIAEQKLGNRHLWPLIYAANKDRNPDPDFIPAYKSIKLPDYGSRKPSSKQITDSVLEAYNGYLLMIEKQPESPKNGRRRQLAARALVSGEILLPGFLQSNSSRILPEYSTLAQNIVQHQYR